MKLHAYCQARKISIARAGRELGIDCRATICRYANGDRVPPPDMVVRIYRWSNGAIKPADWYALPKLKKQAA